jgi:invasion protein IalB
MLGRGEQETERPVTMHLHPIFRTLLACAALSFPVSALAQDQAQETPTEPASAQEQAAEADQIQDETPDLGTLPVDTADAPDGETYIAATHRDWQILCSRFGQEEPELCEMYQLLETEDGPIAEISIRTLPAGAGFPAGATITTPLETFLPPGVAFRVDASQPRQEPFFVCTVIGCIARFALQDTDVAAMQRGASAFLTIASIADIEEPIELPVSLMGFTAALDDLRGRMPAE